MAGLTAPDGGRMLLDDTLYAPGSRGEAVGLGVRMVLQELSVLPTLTVAENIFLTALPHRFGIIDRHRLRVDARRLMDTLGLGDIDPDRPAGTLGIGRRQLVESAAALVEGPHAPPCRVLILDEPTAALSRAETALLFAQVRRLREAGTTVVYITDRLEELMELANRVTVLRDGAIVATADAGGMTTDALVPLMVGGDAEYERQPQRPAAVGNAVALRVEGLRAPPAVHDVSFELRRGEILGLAGLMGAGRTETVRAIFGAAQPAVELSGGNQQKVLIARWLATNPQVLIVDEPTRGIDAGTRWEIYRLLRDLADRGKAILVISSDLHELMLLCDRHTSRLAADDPNAGIGFELQAIAAVVIGGTSLLGGRGSVLGSLFGVLIIAVLDTGLAQIGAQEPVKRLVTGAVILVAVVLDNYRHRRGWEAR